MKQLDENSSFYEQTTIYESSNYLLQIDEQKKKTQETVPQEDSGVMRNTVIDDGMKRLRTPLSERELYILKRTDERVNDCSENDVLFTYKVRSLSRGSVRRLQGRKEWLNDEIMNYYFTLLKKRNDLFNDSNSMDHQCKFFSTWFYEKLMGRTNGKQSEYNYENVKNYTSRHVHDKTLFKSKMIFVPINVGSQHWICGAVDIDKKQIRIYDSFKKDRKECAQHLKMFMEEEERQWEEADANRVTENCWKIETSHIETHPIQNNGWDCGVYVCLFADFLSLQLPLSFEEDDLSLVRQRMIISFNDQFPICTG